nr:MAG TPA: hypothetical protein [Caudoviricetes sp.]
MTNNNVQEMIDEAVEEFRKKLEKEFTELTGTQFECIDNNGELFIADAQELNTGTLILVEDWEVFHILETFEQEPWIIYHGEAYTNEQFAELMREQFVKPKIIHVGI